MNQALLSIVVLLSFQSFAAESTPAKISDFNYYTITNIETTKLPAEASNLSLEKMETEDALLRPALQDGSLEDEIVSINKIINIGKVVWSIVEAGKPVLNLQTNVASALPKGISGWSDLSHWAEPVSSSFAVSAKNTFGIEVVSFKYRIVYVYGGSYNGKGHYIGYASLEPSDIQVAWGFNLDAQAFIQNVFNAGSDKDPVGALQLMMQYKISSPMAIIQQSQSYYMNGKGAFKSLD